MKIGISSGSIVALAAFCLLVAAKPYAQSMKVLVAPVVSAPLMETLPLSGTLTSPKNSDLATRISGSVLKLHVDVGHRVLVGDPLLTLDGKIAKLELEQLAAAEQEAEILYQDAQRLVREARELSNNNNISQTEFESRRAQAAAGKADVSQLRAQHAIAQEQLDRHTLRAPFSGVVAEKLTEVGEWVREDTAVLKLVQMSPLFLEVRVPERYFGRLQVGGGVMVGSTAQERLSAAAVIDSVVPVSDPTTRTFLVRSVISNKDLSLLPGMSVTAEFALEHSQSTAVLQVPRDAIVRKPDGRALVWVVRKSGQGEVAQPVAVSVGRSAAMSIEVSGNGLQPGDRVITLGNESLRPDQPVTVDIPG